MGQQTSKDELLYQQVSYGNIEGIKSLARDGAGFEWVDKEGKTALIQASMNPNLYNVAKTLIDLGANINAYRPGRNAGTPLHHAAKRGLEPMVGLFLSCGANALAINDDCQTPLEVARAKGFCNVVRAIENHICLFSGWMREFHGPGFLESLAPQFVSRKVWVVITPTGSRNHLNSVKLELALYSSLQDAQPRSIIPLWKSNLEEPKHQNSDSSVTIVTNSKSRIRLGPASEGDKAQLRWFCDACKGIVAATHTPAFLHTSQSPAPVATAPPFVEDVELAMAINASIHTAAASTASSSNQAGDYAASVPPEEDVVKLEEVHYPEVDMNPASMSCPPSHEAGEESGGCSSSSCVICMDAPVEGACIPCGHMAGCMSCLNDVKSKKWGCPVCRSKIDQVVRLYAV